MPFDSRGLEVEIEKPQADTAQAESREPEHPAPEQPIVAAREPVREHVREPAREVPLPAKEGYRDVALEALMEQNATLLQSLQTMEQRMKGMEKQLSRQPAYYQPLPSNGDSPYPNLQKLGRGIHPVMLGLDSAVGKGLDAGEAAKRHVERGIEVAKEGARVALETVAEPHRRGMAAANEARQSQQTRDALLGENGFARDEASLITDRIRAKKHNIQVTSTDRGSHNLLLDPAHTVRELSLDEARQQLGLTHAMLDSKLADTVMTVRHPAAQAIGDVGHRAKNFVRKHWQRMLQSSPRLQRITSKGRAILKGVLGLSRKTKDLAEISGSYALSFAANNVKVVGIDSEKMKLKLATRRDRTLAKAERKAERSHSIEKPSMLDAVLRPQTIDDRNKEASHVLERADGSYVLVFDGITRDGRAYTTGMLLDGVGKQRQPQREAAAAKPKQHDNVLDLRGPTKSPAEPITVQAESRDEEEPVLA